MRCWLVCQNCGTKEWVQSVTRFDACPQCGAGYRYAMNDKGEPMVVWSNQSDPTTWDLQKPERK